MLLSLLLFNINVYVRELDKKVVGFKQSSKYGE